jgi:hypothetical protein
MISVKGNKLVIETLLNPADAGSHKNGTRIVVEISIIGKTGISNLCVAAPSWIPVGSMLATWSVTGDDVSGRVQDILTRILQNDRCASGTSGWDVLHACLDGTGRGRGSSSEGIES